MTRLTTPLLPFCLLAPLLGSSSAFAADSNASPEFEQTIVDSKYKPSREEWKQRDTRFLTPASAAELPDVPLNKWGGRSDATFEATGFFRVEKLDGGTFTLVDPDGGEFFSMGLCSVRPGTSDGGVKAMKDTFGDKEGWAVQTLDLLHETGFNTLGCWSHYEDFFDDDKRIAYTTQLNLMAAYGKERGGTYARPGNTGYPNQAIFVFDPEFEAFAHKHAADQIADLKNDPWLLGHFSDNELPLYKDVLTRFLTLDDGEPGKAAAREWWKERTGGKDRKPEDQDEEDFLQVVAERYYRIANEAIKAADPNHLYLGSRLVLSSSRSEAVLKASADHVDVLSINYYHRWGIEPENAEAWASLTGRPYMITEWYAKGMDSNMTNESGAGFTVKTQDDRGLFYENFVLSGLEEDACVGIHWFKYIDNDPTEDTHSSVEENSNKGIVSNRYVRFEPLIERMTKINHNQYTLRDALRGPAADLEN